MDYWAIAGALTMLGLAVIGLGLWLRGPRQRVKGGLVMSEKDEMNLWGKND